MGSKIKPSEKGSISFIKISKSLEGQVDKAILELMLEGSISPIEKIKCNGYGMVYVLHEPTLLSYLSEKKIDYKLVRKEEVNKYLSEI